MPTPSEPTTRAELLARYRAERDKRLRPDGNDQYVEPTGRSRTTDGEFRGLEFRVDGVPRRAATARPTE